MRKLAGLLSFTLLFGSVLIAQHTASKTAQQVAVLPTAMAQVAPGSPTHVTIHVRIAPGMHINSNQVTSEVLRPTELKLQPPTELMVGKVEYPRGIDYTIPLLPDEKLNVYSGNIALRVLVRAFDNTPTGRFRVHGELRYQACSDRECLPPKSVPVAFDVHVTRHH
jgi:hypothetical protein